MRVLQFSADQTVDLAAETTAAGEWVCAYTVRTYVNMSAIAS